MSVMTRALSASQGTHHVYLFSTLDLQHLASCPRQNKYLRTTDGIHEYIAITPIPSLLSHSHPGESVGQSWLLFCHWELKCPPAGVLVLALALTPQDGLNFTLFYIMALYTIEAVVLSPLSPLWPICFIFIHHTFLHFHSCQNIIICPISLFKVICLSYGRMVNIRPGQIYGWVSSSITK